MNRNKNIVFGMLALVVSVVAVGLAYAGFTRTLNINGTGNVVSAKWDIYFANLSNAATTGTANVVTPATISPKTKIGDTLVVNNTTVFDNFESAKYDGNNFTTAHIVNSSNEIIESYVAFKINDTIYYLKGYDEDAYSDNLDELHRAFPGCSSSSCSSGGLSADICYDSVCSNVTVSSNYHGCIVNADNGFSTCG